MTSVPVIIACILYAVDMFLLVPKYTRCKYDHTPRKRKLTWKGFCVGIPTFILAVGTLYLKSVDRCTDTHIILLCGMVLCAVGDIVIEKQFTRGGILFGMGHLLYIVGLIDLTDGLSVFILIVYLAVAGLGTWLTINKLTEKYRMHMLMYNFVVSASFAFGFYLVFAGPGLARAVGAGACCLVISDWLLARNRSYGSTFKWSLLSLVFYFGGQILISTFAFA